MREDFTGWEKDKIVGPTYVESEEEEEDIDEMEFDGEDSGEEEEHDDEKWSDLDNDEREVPPSSARGGKRKRGGRKEPEEEEEVMPTSGRSRRANAGKKTETYSPTKVAEEQRARRSYATKSSGQRRTDSIQRSRNGARARRAENWRFRTPPKSSTNLL